MSWRPRFEGRHRTTEGLHRNSEGHHRTFRGRRRTTEGRHRNTEGRHSNTKRTHRNFNGCGFAMNSLTSLAPAGSPLIFAQVRQQVLKESSGRSQEDSKVAQAIRRQEQLAADLDAQRLAQEQERHRVEAARAEAARCLEDTVESKVRKALAKASLTKAVAQKLAAAKAANTRRAELDAAALNFRLDDLGIGMPSAGSDRHRRNRFALIDKVFALGSAKPVEMEANWKNWLHRFDDHGRKTLKERWPTRLRNQMEQVMQDLQKGDAEAALKWQRRMSREWNLNAGALSVPGKKPSLPRG